MLLCRMVCESEEYIYYTVASTTKSQNAVYLFELNVQKMSFFQIVICRRETEFIHHVQLLISPSCLSFIPYFHFYTMTDAVT